MKHKKKYINKMLSELLNNEIVCDTCHIWNGSFDIFFDMRYDKHKKSFEIIKKHFNIKNTTNYALSIPINKILKIDYPKITRTKRIGQREVQGGSGGWISESDNFMKYTWEISLEDGTIIIHINQNKESSEVEYKDCIYNTRIEEKAFLKHLENYK